MPHVVIESTGELQAVYQAFAPMLQRTEGEIVKVQECYLAKSGREALLDAVVIEQGTARSFFIQLKRHETTITVRLLPGHRSREDAGRQKGDGAGGRTHPEGVPGEPLRQDQSPGVSGVPGVDVSASRCEFQSEE
jgi:hypothetical protein